MTEYNKQGYTFIAPSKNKYKKYDAYKGDKYLTSFGDNRYSQYHDKIGHYSKLDNKDENRKKLYYKRHGKVADFESAKWFAHKFLWT
jgi:hypothetical protein